MEWFGLFSDGLCLAGQAVMHIRFVCRLTGKTGKPRHFAVYLLLLGAVCFVSARFGLNGIWPAGAGALALYAVSRFALGNRAPVSGLSAVLAFYISQLSLGVVGSAEAALFPRFIGKPLLYPLLLAAQALFFALCAGSYRAVEKLLSQAGEVGTPWIGLLLFPGLFFLASELYLLHTSYRFSVSSRMPAEAGKHGGLLSLQILGLAALLCTLYAYRRLCQGIRAQAALETLTQAARAQRVYAAEAQARYEQTRAFRHDVRNHLSVLDGLLSGGRLAESRAYLKKLEAASEALSFPCQTGNPVVDVLLGEKLGLARAEGIASEVSLRLPRPWGVDDFDLCVIFANALDNAVRACRQAGEGASIRVAGTRQGDFFLLTIENTCPEGPLPPEGTGLAGIRAAAEKYRGAVLTEKTGRRFSLSVLLNIS